MSKKLAVIDPVKAGKELTTALASLKTAQQMEVEHGELIAGIALIEARDRLYASVTDDLRAVLAKGQGHAYEVAAANALTVGEASGGVLLALERGYSIADKRGHHFTLLKSKQGITMMPKELGYRFQLEKRGATEIKVQAVSGGVLPRENAAGKFDMIVTGRASCKLDGKDFVVERRKDLPYRLPCYETDGPDGFEAKARRRLMRDLWNEVSGCWEVADETDESATVTVTEPKKLNRSDATASNWEADELRARIDKAVAAYANCKTEAEFESVDGKIAQLFSECNAAAKQEITDARNLAAERLEEAKASA